VTESHKTRHARTHGKDLGNIEAIPNPKPNHAALPMDLENRAAHGSRTALGVQEGVRRERVDVRRTRDEEYSETVKRRSGCPRHCFRAAVRRKEGKKKNHPPYQHQRRLLLAETSSPCLLQRVYRPPLPVRHVRPRLRP